MLASLQSNVSSADLSRLEREKVVISMGEHPSATSEGVRLIHNSAIDSTSSIIPLFINNNNLIINYLP